MNQWEEFLNWITRLCIRTVMWLTILMHRHDNGSQNLIIVHIWISFKMNGVIKHNRNTFSWAFEIKMFLVMLSTILHIFEKYVSVDKGRKQFCLYHIRLWTTCFWRDFKLNQQKTQVNMAYISLFKNLCQTTKS